MELWENCYVIPPIFSHFLYKPIHSTQYPRCINLLADVGGCVIAHLEVDGQSRVAQCDVFRVDVVGIIEDDDLQIYLCFSLVRTTSFGVKDATIEPFPVHFARANHGWPFGRQGQIIKFVEPRLRNATLCFHTESIAMRMSSIQKPLKWLYSRITARKRDKDGLVKGKTLNFGEDLLSCHWCPLVFILRQDSIESITRRAFIITSTSPDEYGGFADQRSLALYRGTKDF